MTQAFINLLLLIILWSSTAMAAPTSSRIVFSSHHLRLVEPPTLTEDGHALHKASKKYNLRRPISEAVRFPRDLQRYRTLPSI